MKKLLKTVVFVFLISNLFVSCDTEDNPKTDDDSKIVSGLAFDNETFYSNKSKWENLNVKNYQFDFEIYLGIVPETIYVTSTVKNGKNTMFSYVVEEGDEKTSKFYEEFKDFEKLFIDELKFETIDDYIIYLEEKYKEYGSVDFEKEQFTSYEMKVYYDSNYSFPYDYRLFKTYKVEPPLMEGDYTGIIGGIKNFKILEN